MKITLTEEKEIELGPAPIIRGLRIGNTEYDVVLHQFHQTRVPWKKQRRMPTCQNMR